MTTKIIIGSIKKITANYVMFVAHLLHKDFSKKVSRLNKILVCSLFFLIIIKCVHKKIKENQTNFFSPNSWLDLT